MMTAWSSPIDVLGRLGHGKAELAEGFKVELVIGLELHRGGGEITVPDLVTR